MFPQGHHYTRQEIHDLVGGGSLQSYLPTLEGVVLFACLRRDTNPGAPRIILPGTGSGIEAAARLLRGQRGSIPVFIKEEANAWEYVGMYELEPRKWTSEDIAIQNRKSGRSDITSVIWMKPADIGLEAAPTSPGGGNPLFIRREGGSRCP